MWFVAAIPWLLLGWVPNQLGAFVGGTAFVAIPQMIGWLLFVGLRTGRMPSAYGRSESRTDSPRWFWIIGGGYVVLLLLFAWVIVGVVLLGF
jgi:hypothetical protein